MNYLLTRGQQIKVVSQLYRKAKNTGFLIPTMRTQQADEQYEVNGEDGERLIQRGLMVYMYLHAYIFVLVYIYINICV